MMHLYWVALKSIWAKEIHRFMRIWVQTLVPPVITMTLYFIIFGNLIGSRIGDMHGFSYMQFIVPGLIMMSVITNAYANVASSFFGAKFQRNIEELLVALGSDSRHYCRICRRWRGAWSVCWHSGDGNFTVFCAISGAFVGIRCLNAGAHGGVVLPCGFAERCVCQNVR